MELTDREQIVDLVHRYSDAVTRYDASVWEATWSADATWDLGKGRSFAGKAEIVSFWHQAMSALNLVVQMVHNGTLTVAPDGQSAVGRWYVTEHLQRASGQLDILLAWYDDTYTCGADGWQFSRRALTRLYAGAPDLTAPFMQPPDSGWQSRPVA